MDLNGDDDIEKTARKIRRLQSKQRQATRQKLQARQLEGMKLKAQREKESSGKEKATDALDLLAQFRQNAKQSSGKDAAGTLSESSMMNSMNSSSSDPTGLLRSMSGDMVEDMLQAYANHGRSTSKSDVNGAAKKKSTHDESKRLSNLLQASMRYHVKKQKKILELEEHKEKFNQEPEEQKRKFAECDDELEMRRRQVRVLTAAFERENRLNSRLHKSARDAETTASGDTAVTRSSPLQRKHDESLERSLSFTIAWVLACRALRYFIYSPAVPLSVLGAVGNDGNPRSLHVIHPVRLEY